MTATRTAIHELDAAEAADEIRAGSLTPTALLDALLARIATLEPQISAFVHLDRETALIEAETLTREAHDGNFRGPLHGVPVAIKDQFLVAGMPNRIGETWGDDAIPTVESTTVRLLRDAGAIILGTTFMPDRHGDPPTSNPWNLEHTPGGSSSGSAAAVAARMVPVALGEQTGGSNLRPAAFCGLAGLKPTYGRSSRKNMYTISWSLDHPGIIARSVRDLALLYATCGAFDPGDPASVDAPPSLWPIDLQPGSPPSIGIVRNYFLERANPEMRQAVESVAERLASAGADVADVMLPQGFDAIWPAWKLVAGAERSTFHAKHTASLVADGVEVKPDPDTFIPGSYYLQSQRIRRWVRGQLPPLFDGGRLLLTPAAVGPAPRGHGPGDNVMNSPWASVGYPTVTLNGGLSSDGLPLGVQFTALPMHDEALIQAAAWCESTLGRLPSPAVTGGVSI